MYCSRTRRSCTLVRYGKGASPTSVSFSFLFRGGGGGGGKGGGVMCYSRFHRTRPGEHQRGQNTLETNSEEVVSFRCILLLSR